MKFLTSALVVAEGTNLAIHPRDAAKMGVTTRQAEKQAEAVVNYFKSRAPSATIRFCEAIFNWQLAGSYLYIVSHGESAAGAAHSCIEQLNEEFNHTLFVASTWAVRPEEKSRNDPPGKADLLVLQKK